MFNFSHTSSDNCSIFLIQILGRKILGFFAINSNIHPIDTVLQGSAKKLVCVLCIHQQAGLCFMVITTIFTHFFWVSLIYGDLNHGLHNILLEGHGDFNSLYCRVANTRCVHFVVTRRIQNALYAERKIKALSGYTTRRSLSFVELLTGCLNMRILVRS